jgi:hypothetical protein
MAKERNRKDTEDRAKPYRDARWHKMQPKFGAVQDIDHLEYTIIDNEVVPIAVMELTLGELNKNKNEYPINYLNAITKRFKTEIQGKFITSLARQLNVNAFIILFNRDVSTLAVYNLSKDKGWNHYTWDTYQEFLKKLYSYTLEEKKNFTK